MADYICVDGGTTNTRVYLVSDKRVVDCVKFSIGAQKGLDGSEPLKDVLKEGITTLLSRHSKKPSDIKAILASGMITSEGGLIKLDHICAPAGPAELKLHMYKIDFPDICDIPFVFIRGVKTEGLSLETADMMRGEETELAGTFCGEGVYILPGSHSKIVSVDTFGRITDFKTMLTGEMIAALSQNTILKASVDLSIDTLDPDKLFEGYEYSNKNGINEALFKVRILANLFGGTKTQVYSFFMGVVLCGEVNYILSKAPRKIVIGGKRQIKDALSLLISKLSSIETVLLSEETVDNSSALGAVKIYEYQQ